MEKKQLNTGYKTIKRYNSLFSRLAIHMIYLWIYSYLRLKTVRMYFVKKASAINCFVLESCGIKELRSIKNINGRSHENLEEE
jgi:hypothetical protein